MHFAQGLEGWVGQDSGSRWDNATFLYLTNSAVFILYHSAPLCRTAKNGEDESAPPKSGGACDPR